MFVSGNEFVFVYTPKFLTNDVEKAVRLMAKGQDLYRLHRYVYTDIKDIPSLWFEIDIPKPQIVGLSKVVYRSPTDFDEHDIEEQFTDTMIEYYLNEYRDPEYIEYVLPPFCFRTEAYEQFLIGVKEADELKKEENAIKAWYQHCSLH